MKTALVTGSSKGIGKQIAIDFLKEGYFVFLNYGHDDLTANDLKDELNKFLEYNVNSVIE